MKISIAMTTYNGESYIVPQLDSLRRQTRNADEIIICDDRSRDKTADIVEQYIRNYQLGNHWSFQVNDQNLGYANNFHQAMLRCTGDIIFFCDQDDVWKLNKLEIMARVFETHSEVQVLYCGYRNYDTTKETKEPTIADDCSGKLELIPLDSSSIYLGTIGCVMAVRRSFLEKIEPYWYSGFAHDEYIWKIGLCFQGVYSLDTVLIDRRCHGKNVSMEKMRTLSKRVHYVEELIKSYVAMAECLDNQNRTNSKEYRLIQHNIEGCRLRLQVLNQRKLRYTIRLLCRYKDSVMTSRTFLIEAYIAVKGINHGKGAK